MTEKNIFNSLQHHMPNEENSLDKNYWSTRYETKTTGWDIGEVSPPLKSFIDTIENRNAAILIPGCGNCYEAEYLLSKGFTNITLIDIAPLLVEKLQNKFAGNSNIKIVFGDFFDHHAKYDYIIEQTFFCALPPSLRKNYVYKMRALLNDNGVLAGVSFNRSFDGGPPFGGSKEEYKNVFAPGFNIMKMETCINSIDARANTELWFDIQLKK